MGRSTPILMKPAPRTQTLTSSGRAGTSGPSSAASSAPRTSGSPSSTISPGTSRATTPLLAGRPGPGPRRPGREPGLRALDEPPGEAGIAPRAAWPGPTFPATTGRSPSSPASATNARRRERPDHPLQERGDHRRPSSTRRPSSMRRSGSRSGASTRASPEAVTNSLHWTVLYQAGSHRLYTPAGPGLDLPPRRRAAGTTGRSSAEDSFLNVSGARRSRARSWPSTPSRPSSRPSTRTGTSPTGGAARRHGRPLPAAGRGLCRAQALRAAGRHGGPAPGLSRPPAMARLLDGPAAQRPGPPRRQRRRAARMGLGRRSRRQGPSRPGRGTPPAGCGPAGSRDRTTCRTGTTRPSTRRPGRSTMNCLDLNCLYALDAWCLAQIAGVLGRPVDAERYRDEYDRMKALINARLWNEKEGFYFDRYWDGRFSVHKAASAFLPAPGPHPRRGPGPADAQAPPRSRRSSGATTSSRRSPATTRPSGPRASSTGAARSGRRRTTSSTRA